MTFTDETTRRVIGATDVIESLSPSGAWGQRLGAFPRVYLAHDEAAWREEQARLREVEAWLNDAVLAKAGAAFAQLPALERPLLMLEAGDILDEVALFEVKRFLYWATTVIALCGDTIRTIGTDWGARLRALMETIHPERQATPRFFLAAQLDERLAAARQEVKRVRREERTARTAVEQQLLAELGGKFDVHGRFVPPSAPSPLRDPRLRAVGGGKYEVIDAALDALANEVAAVTDFCWDIEIEVRQSLSDRLRSEVGLLIDTRDALGELDERCARVVLRREWGGCWPEWGESTAIDAGRHPRLLATVAPDAVQPISITLDVRPAVVTGPNMGGKSMLLELVGLCQWCAQHAYPVPAAHYVFCPVERIAYVGPEEGDIGPSGLSSFAREVRRVVEQGESKAPVLWLLDEFGRGTHPEEGASLARDFIAARSRRGDRVIAATHFPALASMPSAAHFRIAGISHPEALQQLRSGDDVDLEAALRAAMDYRPLPRSLDETAVPRDARLVAFALGLDLVADEADPGTDRY